MTSTAKKIMDLLWIASATRSSFTKLVLLAALMFCITVDKSLGVLTSMMNREYATTSFMNVYRIQSLKEEGE